MVVNRVFTHSIQLGCIDVGIAQYVCVTMPNRRRNYCFAPGCRTGYSRVQDAPKASLFRVPRDEERRK